MAIPKPTIQGGYTNQVVKKVVPTLPKTTPTYTTMASKTPTPPKVNPQTAINSHTTELIKQKASQGVKLDYATPEKQKIYDDYQKHLTGLIEQKASNGQQLDVSNPWKQSIYDNQTKAIQDNIRGLVENGQQLTNGNSYQQGLYDKYNNEFTTKRMTDAVNGEIAQQIKAFQDQLAQQSQASELAVNQNNAFLTEQLGKLQQQKVVNDDSAAKLQNRRGGFYSGGLDYQLGQNASSYNEASGGLQRDIAMRNADINGKNALLAQQASQNITQLQQSAPSLIRERVLAELDRQQGIKMDEAKLTGMYNGSPTFEAQQWNSEFGLKQGEFGLRQRDQDLQEMQVMAKLTGYLPNGQPTTDQQQRELENLWALSEQTGVIHPTLAKLYGIPNNTPTYAAKQDAIQNANESARITLSQQKEARIGSGGTSSSSNSKKTTGSVSAPSVKPKSATNSYNDGIAYWSKLKDDIWDQGAYRVEQQIMSDPEAIQEIRDNGYDINKFIDALWFVGTQGKFKTKADYDKYVKSLTEE